MIRPRLLIVAGHDPTGGAGVSADLAMAANFAVVAVACVSAYTDQDEQSVRALGERPAQEWLAEANQALLELPQAVKFGLLPSAASMAAAAQLIDRLRELAPKVPVVVDPVLAASSGGRFLDAPAVSALWRLLLPRAVILTPNLDEAAELCGIERERLEHSLAARLAAAEKFLQAGAAAVVMKGGHAGGPLVQDLLVDVARAHYWIEAPRRARGRLRGSGCRHATALACGLALGRSLPQAAIDAARAVANLLPPAEPVLA